MKHTFEIKMPKLFGKKKDIKEPEIKTEVEVEEVIDEVVNSIPTKLLVGGALVAGYGVGYLVGHRSGVLRAASIVIFKG